MGMDKAGPHIEKARESLTTTKDKVMRHVEKAQADFDGHLSGFGKILDRLPAKLEPALGGFQRSLGLDRICDHCAFSPHIEKTREVMEPRMKQAWEAMFRYLENAQASIKELGTSNAEKVPNSKSSKKDDCKKVAADADSTTNDETKPEA